MKQERETRTKRGYGMFEFAARIGLPCLKPHAAGCLRSIP